MSNSGKSKISVVTIILVWIMSVPVMLLGYPTLCLLGVGMMPTIISWITESKIGKPRTISIGAFNLCGVVPYVFELWNNYQSFQFVMLILKSPDTWMIMYGICTVGWSIYIAVPKIVLGTLRMKAALRIKQLRKYQENVVKDWGDQVRSDRRIKKQDVSQ